MILMIYMIAPLLAGGISAALSAMSGLWQSIHNSPKQQLKRLRKAGFTSTAMFSNVDTGNITNPSLGASFASGLTAGASIQANQLEIKKFKQLQESLPEEFASLDPENLFGLKTKNIFQAKELGYIGGALADVYNKRADTETKPAIKAKAEAGAALDTARAAESAAQASKIKAEVDKIQAELEEWRVMTPYRRAKAMFETFGAGYDVSLKQIQKRAEEFKTDTYIARNTPLNKIFNYISEGQGSSEDLAPMIQRFGELVKATGGAIIGETMLGLEDLSDSIKDMVIPALGEYLEKGTGAYEDFFKQGIGQYTPTGLYYKLAEWYKNRNK